MLFKWHVLDGLARGTIDLAFRRWARPRVRAGSRLRTGVGVIGVDGVEAVAASRISDGDARRAGFASRSDLLDDLSKQREGRVYRIALRVEGPDPRVALRERGGITDDELADIERRLERLDIASRHGAWTMRVLRLIRDRPAVRAGNLAPILGQETQPFKRDVRKLKELGLTESLEVGYRLSARGHAFLDRVGKRTPRDR